MNVAGTGVVTADVDASPEYRTIFVRLADICQEFGSLGQLNMCNTQVRMQLRFNDRNLVLTNGFASTTVATSNLVAN